MLWTVPHRRYVTILLALFALEWSLLAIAPHDRSDWALENILVGLTLPVLILTYRAFTLSRLSYTVLALFLALHALGAHYTYAEVPYDAWFRDLTGQSVDAVLGLERNSFDRLVHFLYGVLIFYPVREVFVRIAETRGAWGYLLPVLVVMATSMIFELFEWVVAEIFGGDLGIAYLGTQGDVWDAHKDMALASLGAILAMAATLAVNASLGRDVAREWWDSLRVRQPDPLGENSYNKPDPFI